jgi:hypothetical protein
MPYKREYRKANIENMFGLVCNSFVLYAIFSILYFDIFVTLLEHVWFIYKKGATEAPH